MTAQERYEYARSLALRIGSCISTSVRHAASKVTGFASDDNYTGGNVTTLNVPTNPTFDWYVKNAARGPERRRQFSPGFARHYDWNPHCDDKILHAPGECEVCDLYPEAQMLREQWAINFTGKDDPAKTECPAERIRSRATINLWGGNVAHQSGDADFALAQLAASELSPEEIEEAIASLREMKADLAASAPEVFLEEDPRYRAK